MEGARALDGRFDAAGETTVLIAGRGGTRVHTIDAGTLRLDGGAMFGVVPKALWSRRIRADDRNRIPMAMRCLLIETPRARILVDSGIGRVEDDRFREIYGVQNEGTPTRLEDSLRAAAVDPAEIDLVINTHLHFDHAGGNTLRVEGRGVVPAFPSARYVVPRGEWDEAHRENERIRAGYLPVHYEPLAEAGVLDLVEDDREVAPGVRLVHTPGHTAHHHSVLVDLGEETVCYLADLVPTQAHLRLGWIMAYDLEPMVTLESKRRLLATAGDEGWLLVFEHDPSVATARARPCEGRPGCDVADERVDEDRPMEEREVVDER